MRMTRASAPSGASLLRCLKLRPADLAILPSPHEMQRLFASCTALRELHLWDPELLGCIGVFPRITSLRKLVLTESETYIIPRDVVGSHPPAPSTPQPAHSLSAPRPFCPLQSPSSVLT